MTVEVEATTDEDVQQRYWSKRRDIILRQKSQALGEKKSMEKRGIGRYPHQGTCSFCEGHFEMVYATIIDLCRHCTQKAVTRWQDRKIYFKLLTVHANPNIKLNRCQVCNRKDIIVNQVNIKMCPKCLHSAGKLDHFKNRPEKRITIKRRS